MKRFGTSLLWLCWLSLGGLQAQSTPPVPLAELITQSLTNNPNVRASEWDIRANEEKIREVKAGLLPTLNLSGDYKYYTKIPPQVVPASAFGGPEGQYNAAAFGTPFNLGTNLQLTQAVYNARVLMGLKAAKVSRELAQLNLRDSKEVTVYNLSATYYNAQSVAQKILFLEGNIASMQRNIAITQALVDNQLAKNTDLERLKLSKSSLEVQASSLENSYQELLGLLKIQAGISPTQTLEIERRINEQANFEMPSIDTPDRTSMLIIERRQALNELEQRNVKAGAMPTLSAYSVFNYTGFSQPRDNFTNFYSGNWVGLQLQWNLFDGFARRSQLRQKQMEREKIQLQYQQTQDNIQLELVNARRKINTERINLDANRQQVSLAEKILAQSQVQYKEGTAALTDIINAEDKLREAQNNYLEAFVKLRTAELDYRKAAGMLLK